MRFFVFVLFAIALVSGATIYGEIYNSNDFETVSPVVLKISGPVSTQIIVRDGNYSIDLPPGAYTIAGFYYENSTLVYRSYDKINITDQDKTIHFDIVLFEPDEFDIFYSSIEPPEIDHQNVKESTEFSIVGFLPYLVLLLVIGALVFYLINKKSAPSVSRPQAKEEIRKEEIKEELEELDDEERKLLSLLLEASERRALQRDLRKELGFSEAKMSLLIDDLESRGYVKRIKKGRGNIIKLIRGIKWSA